MENKALTVIAAAKKAGAIIFAPQNLDCPPLYKAEVTEIRARPDEFHNMKGKYMPNRAVTDRISEGAGIDFIASECSVSTEVREAQPEMNLPRRTVFIGYAQGRVMMPDGSWRKSTKCEYEFDPILRAKTEGKGDREALEYMKFARQRASTGARLGVIRQLVGMPVTFTQEEVSKPLVFSRIVQNTDYILGTKEGRMMAIAAATGVAAQLYGQKQEAQEVTRVNDEDEPAPYEDADDMPPMESAADQSTTTASLATQAIQGEQPAETQEDIEREGYLLTLEQYASSDETKANYRATLESLLKNGKTQPLAILKSWADRCIGGQLRNVS